MRDNLFPNFSSFQTSVLYGSKYILALTYDPNLHYPEYPKAAMIVFTFIVSYALFATANSSHDALKYAEYRAKYVQATHIPK